MFWSGAKVIFGFSFVLIAADASFVAGAVLLNIEAIQY